MGHLTDSVSFFFRYFSQVLPEARKQEIIINERQRLCTTVPIYIDEADYDTKRSGQFESDKLCSLLFSLFPHTEMKKFITFILSLYAIDEVLQNYRRKRDIRDEHEIRNLFSCLSVSVDPSRDYTCSIDELSGIHAETPDLTDENTDESIQDRCNAHQCRLQLALLPSYVHTADIIKRYMQLYIDLQSYRHYPPIISQEVLKTWSDNQLKSYHNISCWEFCLSTDTFLGIAVMYAAASIPGITAQEIKLLDEVCFPWLSGLVSMLDSAINSRSALGTDELNFSSFYKNLKEFENRIMFFAHQAEIAGSKLKDSRLYQRIIKAITVLYISHPETSFSMLKLTSSSISKAFSLNTYKRISTMLRCLHLL